MPPLTLLLPLLLSAAPHAVSAPASVAVTAVTFPEKRAGGRELRFALGEEAEEAARVAVAEGVAAAKAFPAMASADADVALEVEVARAWQDLFEAGPLASLPTRVTCRAMASVRWRRGGQVVHEAEVEAGASMQASHVPSRADLRAAWRDAFLELGKAAAAQALATGAMGLEAGGWLRPGRPLPK